MTRFKVTLPRVVTEAQLIEVSEANDEEEAKVKAEMDFSS
jgi:hypothetical protein